MRRRDRYNRRFLKRTIRQKMTCDNCELDAQQIEAVVACEDAQLVLASAGSGKTMSLLAKIEYLNRQLKIPAEQILVISFTQKTVMELKERCSVKNVEIRTFHSLGNSILQSTADASLGPKQLIGENETLSFLRRFCEFLIKRNKTFARSVIDFILFFYSAPLSPALPSSHSARISYNRLYLRRALQSSPNESIRTKDEQLIANWLYLHGIPYSYQREIPNTKYRPSFTLELPQKIYLDYFYIDQKGHSMYGAQYLRDMKWRLNYHRQNNTRFINLPSWRWNDCSIFNYLAAKLSRYRVKAQRQNDDLFYHQLLQNSDYYQEVEGFYQLLHSFLLLHKNNQFNLADIKERLKTDDIYSERRNELFLHIYRCLQYGYERYLQNNRQFDFADMINHATQCVKEIEECARGYKYILLDEVQDLSRNRYLLVKAILHKNPGCKIFAVGDDWQSIYRFAGSDLTLIQKFEQYFKLKTRRSFIESTHRFGQPTINISCNFIQRNSKQSHKKVHNIQPTKTPIHIILNRHRNTKEGQDAESLQIILQTLIAEFGYDIVSHKTLQIIARYNHDIARIKSEQFLIKAQNDTLIYDIL